MEPCFSQSEVKVYQRKHANTQPGANNYGFAMLTAYIKVLKSEESNRTTIGGQSVEWRPAENAWQNERELWFAA